LGLYLGAVKLFWCETCNVPLLDEKCSLCGGVGTKVNISPPGDARPAFRGEIEILQKAVMKQFGVRLPHGCIVLNKVPYLDHMDEVIINGVILGALRFNIFKFDWEFVPRLAGGCKIWQFGGKKWVCVDEGAVNAILKGSANLLGPGVVDCDPEINVDDQVILVTREGDVFGVGVAKKSGEGMLRREKGVAVKVREKGVWREKEGKEGGTWENAVKANEEALAEFERKAIRFIRNVARNYGRPVTVAFSGGKDSLVTLLLAVKALGLENLKVLFIDTGVEFPETVKYTYEIVEKLGVNLLTAEVGEEAFWELVEMFGPPGRDYRICCKRCKLGPLTKLIEENFPEGCVTFIGRRSYESEARFREPKVSVNPWVPKQISAYPIKDWTALHVWLYIFREKADYNPLYEIGFNRIGCWPCPASKVSEIRLLKERHRELYDKLMSVLETWRERYGYPKEWIKYGFWRWKRLPRGHIKLAERLGVNVPAERPAGGEKISYSVEEERWNVTGVLRGRFNCSMDMPRIKNIANVIGKVTEDKSEIIVEGREGVCRLSVDGTFEILGESRGKLKRLEKLMFHVVVRAMRCVGCGECTSACKKEAILIKWGLAWIMEDRCIHCSKCLKSRCTAFYANA